MSVRSCTFPWHWLVIDGGGNVLPCSHGAGAVGNVRDHTLEEIWNGPALRSLREAILADRVHPLCQCAGCPFQQVDPAHPQTQPPLEADAELIATFNEAWYLARHPHIQEAVAAGTLSSGLEHFIRNGRSEGADYKTAAAVPGEAAPPIANAVLALWEFSARRTFVTAFPSDIVVVVTTVCNLRCVMCPQGMREVKNPAHTPEAIVERCATFLRHAQRVILSGIGEAMLAPAFWSIIAALKDKRAGLLRLHSNGHFIGEANAARLLDSGLNLLMISLDAATPATYRKIRGADLAAPLAGIRRLVARRKAQPGARLHIAITMTLMRDNVAEAAGFVALARELEVDTAIFSQIFPFGDRPDWVIAREGGDFVYADQMLAPIRPAVTRHLQEALTVAETLAVKVVLHDNVESYR